MWENPDLSFFLSVLLNEISKTELYKKTMYVMYKGHACIVVRKDPKWGTTSRGPLDRVCSIANAQWALCSNLRTGKQPKSIELKPLPSIFLVLVKGGHTLKIKRFLVLFLSSSSSPACSLRFTFLPPGCVFCAAYLT